jgi:hypothetical protein
VNQRVFDWVEVAQGGYPRIETLSSAVIVVRCLHSIVSGTSLETDALTGRKNAFSDQGWGGHGTELRAALAGRCHLPRRSQPGPEEQSVLPLRPRASPGGAGGEPSSATGSPTSRRTRPCRRRGGRCTSPPASTTQRPCSPPCATTASRDLRPPAPVSAARPPRRPPASPGLEASGIATTVMKQLALLIKGGVPRW